MKKIFTIFIVVSVIMFSGCGKDYLDTPKPTDVVTKDAVFSTRAGVEAYLSGIYRMFRNQYIYIKNPAPGTQKTDVGGLYSVLFARSVKGKDLIQSATWYYSDYDHTNRAPTFRRVSVTWQYLYDLVNHANTIIQNVGTSSLSTEDKKELIAHGKALRAYFYLQLALEFAPAYTVDPNFLALPLYDTSDPAPKGLSTLKDVYAFMLKDINDAIDGLTDDRLGKSYINKSVAYGIKVEILMAMNQDWDQVEAAAHAAYGGNVAAALSPSTYASGFNDINNTEWMWGMDQQSDQSNYYYCAPHAFTDHQTESYSATYVDKDFVNLFSATDVRALFLDLYKKTNYRHYETSKFKFAFDSDIPIMRTSEMILAEAEAKYHQGFEQAAHDLLFLLQQNRDVNAIKSSNTGTALLDEILVERRKELYGENGVEWFDAKRLQRGIVRGAGHRTILTLQPNDKRFYLTIPQAEIDANSNIDKSINANRL